MHEIGQHIDRGSPLHSTDARIKLLTVLALSVVILKTSPGGLLVTALFLLTITLYSKVGPLELFLSTRPVWPFFVILFLVYVFTTPGVYLAAIPPIPIAISREGLYLGTSQISRFFLLLLAASLLTMTTSLIEITMALEHLLRPLQIIGISSHNTALMVNMALRFIPLLQREMLQIRQAAAARGAAMRHVGVQEKIRLLVYLCTPLVLNIIRRSDELVQAMEARGYQPGPRTYLSELVLSKSDFYSLGLVLLLIFLLLCLA